MNEVKIYKISELQGYIGFVGDEEFVPKDYYATLQQQLTATTNILKSAGIEADTLQAGVMELKDKLRIKQNHIKLRDTYIEELEKRAEAAEAKADNLSNGWLNAISERDDARAKLAELENQEPIMLPGIFDAFSAQTEWQKGFKAGQAEYKDEILELGDLFTRPAPAIDLDAVRAEGLDMAAAEIDRWVGCGSLAREIRQKSAQLRAGNAGKDGSHD